MKSDCLFLVNQEYTMLFEFQIAFYNHGQCSLIPKQIIYSKSKTCSVSNDLYNWQQTSEGTKYCKNCISTFQTFVPQKF